MTRLAALLSLLVALPATASSLQSLMSEDRLRLKAWLTPETDIVVGQEVRLTLELATPRWFAGGTRFALPEIRNVIVLRRNQFATNFSRREGGATWVVQQWQLELYPQAVGQFRVPRSTAGWLHPGSKRHSVSIGISAGCCPAMPSRAPSNFRPPSSPR